MISEESASIKPKSMFIFLSSRSDKLWPLQPKLARRRIDPLEYREKSMRRTAEM